MKNFKTLMKIILVVVGLSVLTMFYLIFAKQASSSDLTTNDLFVFSFGVASAFYGIYFALMSLDKSANDQQAALHQSIGGYIPSKELNDLVQIHFIRCGGTLKPKMNFVSKWKDTEKIIPLLESHSFDMNVAKKKVVCKVKRNGSEFTAASASREMALCIAFLMACNVNVE